MNLDPFKDPCSLAKGGLWERKNLLVFFADLGVHPSLQTELCLRAEDAFSRRALKLGTRLEWSSLHGEVTGDMQDLQIDIDHLRDRILEAVVDHWKREEA